MFKLLAKSAKSSCRPATRNYATKGESFSVDIDSLLERVKVASTNQKNKRYSNSGVAGKILGKQDGKRANANRRTQDGQPFNELGLPQQDHKLSFKPSARSKGARNFNQVGDAFTEISSTFDSKPSNYTNRYGSRNVNANANQRFKRGNNNNQSSPSIMTSNLRNQSQGQRQNRSSMPKRSNRTNNTRSSSGSSTSKGKAINSNYDHIQTSYIPEIPTLDSLLSHAQLTSQTPASRILRAYAILKSNPDADVSDVLNGKGISLTDDVVGKMNTGQLELNAHSVVNALNKNSSLPLSVKERLVGPLVGLQPVKALSA